VCRATSGSRHSHQINKAVDVIEVGLDYLQTEGISTVEELNGEVNRWNADLSKHLSDVDTYVPKVNC
jgi:hypothetical protein